MKTIITFEFEEGDGNRPEEYANPIKYLITLGEINSYMRELYKYGHSFASADDAVEKIRTHILELCEGLPEDYRV